MPTIDANTAPPAGAYDAYGPAPQQGGAPVEAGPSQPELEALWNLVMINATSLYQEAFSLTQEAAEDDDQE